MVRNLSKFNGCVVVVCLLLSAVVAVAQDCDPDVTAPVIVIPGPKPLVAECGVSVKLPFVQGDDACDGLIMATVKSYGGLMPLRPAKGTYNVTFEATDSAGNTGTGVLEVIVSDTSAPIISRCGGSPTIAVDGANMFAVPILTTKVTVADACDIRDDLTVTQFPLAGEVLEAPGTPSYYPVEITIEDTEGNSSSCTAWLNLVDVSMPVIVPRMYDYVSYVEDPATGFYDMRYYTEWECGAPYDDARAIAFDSLDGDLTDKIEVLGAYQVEGTNLGGEYEVVYSVTNSRGIRAEVTRYVTIVDRVSPAMSLTALEGNRSGATELEVSYEEYIDPELKDQKWLWELRQSPETYPWVDQIPDRFGAYNSPVWDDEQALIWSCDIPYQDPGLDVFDLCDGTLDADSALVVVVRVQKDKTQQSTEGEPEAEGEGEGEGDDELPYDETNDNGETEVFQWGGYYDELTEAQLEFLSARWFYNDFELYGYRIYYFVSDSTGKLGYLSRHVVPTYTWDWVTAGEEYIEIDCGDESIFETLHLLELQDRYYTSCLGDVSHLIERSGDIDVTTPGSYRRLYTRPGIDLWWADRWGQVWKRTIVVLDADPEIVLLDEMGQALPQEEITTQLPMCQFSTMSNAEIEIYFENWWAITPKIPVDDPDYVPGETPEFGFYVTDACDDADLLTSQTVVWGDGLLADALKIFAQDNSANISRNWLLTYSARDSLNNNVNIQRKIVLTEDYNIDLLDGSGMPLVPDINDEIWQTVECGDAFVLPNYTVESACTTRPPEVTVATQAYDEFGAPLEAVNTGLVGDYSVVYTVTDAFGNETTATIYVEVVDTIAPSIQLGAYAEEELDADGFLLLECGAAMSQPADFVATDICDGDLGAVQAILAENMPGVMAYAWMLDETLEPVWNEDEPALVSYDVFNGMPGDYLLLYQLYDGVGNMYPVLDEDGIPPIFDIDGNGNFLNEENEVVVDFARLVRVVDTTAPVITLNGEEVLETPCGETFEDPGALVVDDCDGGVEIVVTGEVLTGVPGEYQLVYNAEDASGNVAFSVLRTVTVKDETAPVLTLVGIDPLTLECGDEPDMGATASDSCDGDLTASIVIGGNAAIGTVVGSFTETYNVVDASGNAAEELTRTVNVEDTIAPVITLLGADAVDVACGAAYTEAGATAVDSCDGDISASIMVAGDVVDTSVPGTYVRTYNVSDASMNAAVELTRAVTVLDNCAEGEGEPVEGEGEAFEGEGETVEGEGEPVEGEGEAVEGEGEPVEGEGEAVEGEGEPVEGEQDNVAQDLLDLFDQTDADGNGSLSYDEAIALVQGLSQSQFDALDANGDGNLSKEELLTAIYPDGIAEVPDVVGLLRETAFAAIENAGLKVASVSLEFSDTIPMDHIISQSPDAGVLIALNSGVSLVQSKGPEYIEKTRCGCSSCNNEGTEDAKAWLQKVFSDWLLIGIAMLGLCFWKTV